MKANEEFYVAHRHDDHLVKDFSEHLWKTTTGSWSGKPLYVKSDPARAVRPGNELNHGTVTFGAVQDRYSTKRKAWSTLNHDNTNQGLQACRGASLKGQMVEGIIQ
ncbi:unnamed protein product, partial [Nesidiocoris tenuis]